MKRNETKPGGDTIQHVKRHEAWQYVKISEEPPSLIFFSYYPYFTFEFDNFSPQNFCT